MSSTRRMLIVIASSCLGLVIGALSATVLAQKADEPAPPAPPPPAEVRMMKLPLELPAIGNVDAVKTWRFGRIESVVQAGGSNDVKINIRVEGDRVLETIGPRVLGDLARASNWVVPETGNTQLVRADYVERMVAFDVDGDNRIIAMISMEPLDRDRRRLSRGL